MCGLTFKEEIRLIIWKEKKINQKESIPEASECLETETNGMYAVSAYNVGLLLLWFSLCGLYAHDCLSAGITRVCTLLHKASTTPFYQLICDLETKMLDSKGNV